MARIDAVLAPNSLCGQCYRAEVYRMRGELLLARDGLAAAGDALDCFQQALALGLEKGALAWELRATMSIVRLREQQGDARAAELVEALSRLRELYGRFTEGLGLPDPQEAAALMRDASREEIS